MIINAVTEISDSDVGASCWRRLRRFQNVDFLRDHIIRLHQISDGAGNERAKRQAENIRYCLVQAREYAQAASCVTLATQPNLAYYSIMSLAVAEVLLKQMREMHLHKMREAHAHHGLELGFQSLKGGEVRLEVVADALTAAPVFRRADASFGTFELWHRSAREIPVIGERKLTKSRGYTSSQAVIYEAADERFRSIPKRGISLLDCMKRLPPMTEILRSNGIAEQIVRARCSATQKLDEEHEVSFDFQPGPATEDLISGIQVRPSDYECVKWQPFEDDALSAGGTLTVAARFGYSLYLPLPHCCTEDSRWTYFWPGEPILNEFGYYYLSLYILGNYCRYYPDKWLKDVERATPLAQAAERLLVAASDRVPLLALSEMARTYYFIKR